MAKSLSARFGLQRWSADSDTQQRSEFDNDAAQLELYAAKTGHGTITARPAASAAWADSFWLITDATGGGVIGTLYYCDGTTWTVFAPRKQGLATNRPAAGLATQAYYKTDSDLLSIDDGTAWHDFPSKAVTDGAYPLRSEVVQARTDTSETTASTAYTNLATVTSVAANIGASGKALVMLSCWYSSSAAANDAGITSVAVSGATTLAANDSISAIGRSATSGTSVGLAGTFLMTGLTAGSNTFAMQFRVTGATGSFQNRRLIVIPL